MINEVVWTLKNRAEKGTHDPLLDWNSDFDFEPASGSSVKVLFPTHGIPSSVRIKNPHAISLVRKSV